FFFRKLGGGEFLAVERDLGDAHGSVSLAMSAQLLILLLALVMEDQNLRGAALLHDFTGHERSGLGAADLAGLAGDSQHLVEFYFPVGAVALILESNHIAGRHPVLLTSGADDRVHTYASVQSCARPRSGAIAGNLLNFLCLLSASTLWA